VELFKEKKMLGRGKCAFQDGEKLDGEKERKLSYLNLLAKYISLFDYTCWVLVLSRKS